LSKYDKIYGSLAIFLTPKAAQKIHKQASERKKYMRKIQRKIQAHKSSKWSRGSNSGSESDADADSGQKTKK